MHLERSYNSDNSPMWEVVMGLIAAHYRFSSNSPSGVRHMGLLGTCDMNQHPLITCIPMHNASALWNNAYEWRFCDTPRNGMQGCRLISKWSAGITATAVSIGLVDNCMHY